jgi:SPW repeat
VAPFATGYSTVNSVATTEAVGAGLLIGGFGLWLALTDNAPQYVDYLLGLFGIWSIAAPFVFGYRALVAACYSDVVVGVVVFIAAIASIYSRSHHGALHRTPQSGDR